MKLSEYLNGVPMHDKTKQILRVLREYGEWDGWLGGQEVTITLDDTTQEAEITTSAGGTQAASGDWELDEIVCNLMEQRRSQGLQAAIPGVIIAAGS